MFPFGDQAAGPNLTLILVALGLAPLPLGLAVIALRLWCGIDLIALGRQFAVLRTARLSVPKTIAPGQMLEMQIQLCPWRPLYPTGLEWTLIGEEVVNQGSGQGSVEITRRFVQIPYTIAISDPLSGGEMHEFSAAIPVPPEAPTSVSTLNGRAIRWQVQTRLQLPRGPDPTLSSKLQVVVDVVPPPEPHDRWTRQEQTHDGWRCELAVNSAEASGVPVARALGRLKGKVRSEAQTDIPSRQSSVRLIRHIWGSAKGGLTLGQDRHVAHEQVFHTGPIAAGQVITGEFDLPVPASDGMTFQGQVVRWDWYLEVLVDQVGSPDRRVQFPIRLVS